MQRFLLDTHVFLWWLADDSQLGEHARTFIGDERNDVYVSAATAWEISIKRTIGKLEAPQGLGDYLEEAGFAELPVTFFHGERAGSLPPHHRDPFDRMLVAQAQAEGLIVMTNDSFIPLYGVRTMRA